MVIEPNYRKEGVPAELLMRYGLKFDNNHALPITSEFVREQIIDMEGMVYRDDSIMKGMQDEDKMPNWLIFFTGESCSLCMKVEPQLNLIA